MSERIALVTGASRGLGRALALALAQRGCAVALFARSRDALEEVARRVRAHGVPGLAIDGDACDPAAAELCVERVRAELGPLAILVNNAGLFRTAPFVDTGDALWREVVELNLCAAFRFARAAARAMISARRGGTIVNVASAAGRRAFAGNAAYCASKFGLVGLTEVMREELRACGIRVVLACPGRIDTEAWDRCGIDLRAAGIRREAMLRPERVAEWIADAACDSSSLVVDEIALSPPAGC